MTSGILGAVDRLNEAKRLMHGAVMACSSLDIYERSALESILDAAGTSLKAGTEILEGFLQSEPDQDSETA